MLVEGDVVQGVRVASGEVVRCPRVVSNAGVQNTFGRLLQGSSPGVQAAKALLPTVQDTYAIVGLNIGFKASHAELGFTPANIWSHPEPDFEANLVPHRQDFDAPFPWHFITFPSTKDPLWERDFPGRATVEMYAYTDYSHFARWAGTPGIGNSNALTLARRKRRVGSRAAERREADPLLAPGRVCDRAAGVHGVRFWPRSRARPRARPTAPAA